VILEALVQHLVGWGEEGAQWIADDAAAEHVVEAETLMGRAPPRPSTATPFFVKMGVKPREVEAQRLALASGVRTAIVVSFDEASGELVMEHLAGMSVSDWNGEEDADTPSEEYEHIRVILRQLAAVSISYPDVTGYNFIRLGAERAVIDFGHAELGDPCAFMQRFLDGHDGWNPEFR